MANWNYSYQYETSPRKLEPDYRRPEPKKKKPVQKKASPKKKAVTKKKVKDKFKLSFEFKFFINSMLVFAVVFAIIACQALVEQKYKEKESLKKEYSELLASNNLTGDSEEDIRILASQYGMQTKSATLIDLGTSDYIESSGNRVKREEKGFLNKIIDYVKNIF